MTSQQRSKLKSRFVIGTLIFVFAALTLTAPGQDQSSFFRKIQPNHRITVIGLLNLDDVKCAFLEVQNSFSGDSLDLVQHQLVRIGERWEDSARNGGQVTVETTRIDFTNALVEATENGTPVIYHMNPDKTSNAVPVAANLRWASTNCGTLLDFYSALSGKGLLIYPTPASAPTTVAFTANVTNKTGALRRLEQAVNERHLIFLPDGDKFIQVVPKLFEKKGRYQPPALPLAPTESTENLGIVQLVDVPVEPALDFYAKMARMKIQDDKPHPDDTITFNSQGEITRAEALHAFDVLLGWRGIKVVKVDDQPLKVFWSIRDY